MRQEVILGMSRRAVARISPQTWREITSEAKNIAEIEWKLNHRLRKSLGYLTPLEYFKKSYNFDLRSRFTSILNSAFNLKKLENIGENGELCGQMP